MVSFGPVVTGVTPIPEGVGVAFGGVVGVAVGAAGGTAVGVAVGPPAGGVAVAAAGGVAVGPKSCSGYPCYKPGLFININGPLSRNANFTDEPNALPSG